MQRTPLAVLTATLFGAGPFAPPAQAQEIAFLDEIIVTATRIPTPLRESLSDVSVLDRAAVERQDHATLPDLLAGLPGVQVTTNGGPGTVANLSLRGGNAGHSVILVDGMRISSATLGTTALQAIPLEQVERVEVVRGPLSSIYGTDAMSGVVQVFTAEGSGRPAPTAFLGAGSHGTAIASAGYGGQVDDTRFNLRVGLESSDGFSTIKAPKGGLFDMYNADDDAYDNRNASARVARRVSRDLELGAAVFYARALKHYDAVNCDAAYALCTTDFDNRSLQRLESYQAHADYRVNDAWNTRLRLGRSIDYARNWLLDPSTSLVTVDHYQTRQNQLLWQNDIKAWGGMLSLSGERRVLDVDSSKTFVVTEQDTDSVSLGYQARFGDHAVQASGRRDWISRLGGHDSGSLAYGYRLNPAWSVRAAYGTAFHAPSFNDLYWPLDPVNFFQGNPNLQPETARNREIGLRYERGGRHAGLTAYHNKISNLIDYAPGVAPTWIGTMDNVNAATIKGLSLEYGGQTGAWTWRAAMDYLDARDDATGKTLQRRAPRTGSLDLRRDFGRFDLGARVQASSSRYNDRANTQRLAGYATLGLDANYRIAPAWRLEARVDNLFDQDYTQVRSTLSPYNDYAVPGRAVFVGLRYVPK